MTSNKEHRSHYIRLLKTADRQAFDRMMHDSFSTAEGFKAHPRSITWGESDECYPTLGLFHNNELKAMLRMECIHSDQEFLFKADESEIPFPLNFPMGYIAKTATATDCKKKNFNTLLRYHAFKVFSIWRTASVLGIMVEGSPRVSTMRDLGYYFFNKKKKWSGSFSSDRNVFLAILDGHDKINEAIKSMELKLGSLIAEYPALMNHNDVQMASQTNFVFPGDRRSA